MSTFNTVRAWKDEEYRLGLSQVERERLQEHPAGASELSDDQLTHVSGGTGVIGNSLAGFPVHVPVRRTVYFHTR